MCDLCKLDRCISIFFVSLCRVRKPNWFHSSIQMHENSPAWHFWCLFLHRFFWLEWNQLWRHTLTPYWGKEMHVLIMPFEEALWHKKVRVKDETNLNQRGMEGGGRGDNSLKKWLFVSKLYIWNNFHCRLFHSYELLLCLLNASFYLQTNFVILIL